jgi:hypothetical protein
MPTRSCIACGICISSLSGRPTMCRVCRFARMHDPAKRAAHKAVADARRHGQLADPCGLPCTDCAGIAIEYDHREYAKPLKVDAVCRRCNLRRGPAIDSAAFNTSRIRPRPIVAQEG